MILIKKVGTTELKRNITDTEYWIADSVQEEAVDEFIIYDGSESDEPSNEPSDDHCSTKVSVNHVLLLRT